MIRRMFVTAILFGAIAVFLGGCVFCSPLSRARRSERMVLETVVPAESMWTMDRVLLIGIDGVLSIDPDTGGLLSGPSTVIGLKDALRRAERDATIGAVILRINSPGGGVTASDVIYEELRRFKEKTGKKVVALMMDVAASGGYYVAMAADRVIAHPTSVTGSIGVVAMFPEVEGLSRKIGLDMRVIKSGAFKDMGSMWRTFSEEERGILQGTIDEMYGRFVQVVTKGRPKLTEEQVRKLADGRIYTAKQAKEAGLIDEIGYMNDAFDAAKKLAGVDDAAMVTYRQPYDYAGHYYAEAPDGSGAGALLRHPQFNLLNIDLRDALQSGGSPFYYLWVP